MQEKLISHPLWLGVFVFILLSTSLRTILALIINHQMLKDSLYLWYLKYPWEWHPIICSGDIRHYNCMILLVLILQTALLRVVFKWKWNVKGHYESWVLQWVSVAVILNITKPVFQDSGIENGICSSMCILHWCISPPDCTESMAASWDGICNN